MSKKEIELDKPVRLTKTGKPDKRAISSKKNLEKGKMKVQEILKKAKHGGKNKKDDSDTETSDDEYELISKKSKSLLPPEPEILPQCDRTMSGGQPKEPVMTSTHSPDYLKKILDESEMTKKEIIELKKMIALQEQKERDRIDNEIKRDIDRVRQQAYGRLNSLSQNMSMKFH